MRLPAGGLADLIERHAALALQHCDHVGLLVGLLAFGLGNTFPFRGLGGFLLRFGCLGEFLAFVRAFPLFEGAFSCATWAPCAATAAAWVLVAASALVISVLILSAADPRMTIHDSGRLKAQAERREIAVRVDKSNVWR